MANQTNNTQDVNSSKIDAGALVQAGIGGAGALSTAYSIYGNVKNKEDLIGRINSMYDAPYRGTDSFDSLTQSYLNYSPYRNLTMDEIGFNKGAAGMNVASASMQGAGAGAAFGPWGALIGGVAGLGAGLFGFGAAQRKAKRTLDFANSKISEVNKYNLAGLDNRLANAQKEQFSNLKLNSGYALRGAYGGPLGVIEGPIDYSMAMQYLDMKNDAIHNKLMADGGQLHSHGSDWNTGLNYVGNGGSHEENPYDGVPMGIAPDGQPNLVEEGEVIWNNDYVFSKRLKVPKAIRRKYKLGGVKPLTFAEAAMKANKEAEERPNDPITIRGRDAILGALAEVQETKRMQKEAKEQQENMLQGIQPMIAANGGAIHIDKNKRGTFTAAASRHGKSVQEFASQVLANPENYSPAMRRKANFARNAAKWHSNGGHLYEDAGWLDNYTNWWNSRRNFNPNTAQAAIDRLNKVYSEPFYRVPSPISIWDRNLNYTEDGKNLSKDVMNWFTQQSRRIGGNDFRFNEYSENNNFLDAFNNFLSSLDEETIRGGTEAILNKANKGAKGPISRGIQSLYDTYGKEGNDARVFSYLDNATTPRILPQTLLNPTTLTNPTSRYPILNAANNLNTTIQNSTTQPTKPNSGNNKTGSSWLTGLRYAPVVGSAISVLNDIFGGANKPTGERGNAIREAARGLRDVAFDPVGGYMAPDPLDLDYILNALNGGAGANRDALLNTAGGNRGTAMAGILASDNQYLNAIGNARLAAEKENFDRELKRKEFNAELDKFNKTGLLQAAIRNQGKDEVVAKYLALAADADAQEKLLSNSAISADLTNLFDNLGAVGTDALNRADTRWLAQNWPGANAPSSYGRQKVVGYQMGLDGQYIPIYGKNGGKLSKRRRK